MKKTLLLKTMLLLCALVAGSSSVWADGEPNWSYTFVSGDASKLNTTDQTITVDASHVWSYDGTTVAAGTPAVATGTANSTFGIKFGSSGSNYFSPVILSTSAFSDKAITKVSLYLKHNGSKAGTLTVKQGKTTIGTATTSSTSSWITVTCSETKKGAGGALTIQYEVAQALYINKIEVWYESLGTVTTTTIDDSDIINTDVYLSTAAGSFSASVKETVSGDAVGGASVSWTSSDEDVATVASDGTVTLKKKGTTTITATYAGDATYAGSSADYVLNVTSSAPQATDISVATNYEWLGVSNGSSIAAGDLPKSIDCEGVTVTIGTGGSTKPRGDDTYIRLYAGNSLTFKAPANYFIKEIAFTKANEKWSNPFDVDAGTWDNTNLKWTGFTNEVTLTEDGSSGNDQMSQIDITLVQIVPVSITAAEWASFSSDKALDFTDTGVKAYIAKYKDASAVTLTEVKKVPANTGIIVNGAFDTHNIPVLSGAADDVSGNLLQPWLMSGEPTDGTYYTLAAGPTFKQSTGGTLAAGKAYLVLPSGGAPELNILFDGLVTGVNDVRTKTADEFATPHSALQRRGDFFDLQGRKVANPTKGLYIVNGKKVAIK